MIRSNCLRAAVPTCLSVIAADCGVQSPFIWAMGSRYLRCAICVIAGQYATSHCKPLLFWFPRKRRYINVQTFNLYRLIVKWICIEIYSGIARSSLR